MTLCGIFVIFHDIYYGIHDCLDLLYDCDIACMMVCYMSCNELACRSLHNMLTNVEWLARMPITKLVQVSSITLHENHDRKQKKSLYKETTRADLQRWGQLLKQIPQQFAQNLCLIHKHVQVCFRFRDANMMLCKCNTYAWCDTDGTKPVTLRFINHNYTCTEEVRQWHKMATIMKPKWQT